MQHSDTYHTIEVPSQGEFRDRGSRFLGFAWPVKSEAEVKQHLQQIKKEHPQANHHCYAFRLATDPSVYRASDDREPSGSAGKPILAAITSLGLTNVLVIVVRYFGGSLLGVPGLIHAYREAAATALEQSRIITQHVTEVFLIEFPYALSNEVHQFLRQQGAAILQQTNDEKCNIRFELRKSALTNFEKAHQRHSQLSYKTNLTRNT